MQSSTQWCNLYSNASKYNILIGDSRYKLAVYAFLVTLTLILSIITLTYHYLLAIAVVAFGTMLISLILSLDSIRPNYIAIPSFFFSLKTVVHKFFVDDAKGSIALIKPVLILGNTGEVMFSVGQGNEADDQTYQLLSNSRFSFIGCWLVLSPTSNTNHLAKVVKPAKEIFIFKDSISEQDYSRIARVINQL